MGLHTGEASERDGDYFGPALNRTARLMAIAHGGQVVCSGVTHSILSDHLSGEWGLRDLGERRLRDLAEPVRVFQLVHPRLLNDFPPLRSLDRLQGNLPIQTTAFVGRENEIAEVLEALATARLVTLCGVGGVGKTRLALQVAADSVTGYPHGAWLVELADIGSPDDVDEAVTASLGIQSPPGVPTLTSILQFLRDKSLLLVLDNCEHVLTPVSSFVDAALQGASGLRVLATSREGLVVRGERVLMVPPLRVPGTGTSTEEILQSESVRLFVDRARESNSAFIGDNQDAQAMMELCRRLDGIPLAIELAAARVGSMTPVEITARLAQRFKLLTRGRRTAATRQQTLRNTIDWSYELLHDSERPRAPPTVSLCGRFRAGRGRVGGRR